MIWNWDWDWEWDRPSSPGNQQTSERGFFLAGSGESTEKGLLRFALACTIPIRLSDCLSETLDDVTDTLGLHFSRACSSFFSFFLSVLGIFNAGLEIESIDSKLVS